MIQNVTGARAIPHVPDNYDRRRVYESRKPQELGNAIQWKWLTDEAAFAEAYAREECANGREQE